MNLHLHGSGDPNGTEACVNTGKDIYVDTGPDELWYCSDAALDFWVKIVGSGGGGGSAIALDLGAGDVSVDLVRIIIDNTSVASESPPDTLLMENLVAGPATSPGADVPACFSATDAETIAACAEIQWFTTIAELEDCMETPIDVDHVECWGGPVEIDTDTGAVITFQNESTDGIGPGAKRAIRCFGTLFWSSAATVTSGSILEIDGSNANHDHEFTIEGCRIEGSTTDLSETLFKYTKGGGPSSSSKGKISIRNMHLGEDGAFGEGAVTVGIHINNNGTDDDTFEIRNVRIETAGDSIKIGPPSSSRPVEMRGVIAESHIQQGAEGWCISTGTTGGNGNGSTYEIKDNFFDNCGGLDLRGFNFIHAIGNTYKEIGTNADSKPWIRLDSTANGVRGASFIGERIMAHTTAASSQGPIIMGGGALKTLTVDFTETQGNYVSGVYNIAESEVGTVSGTTTTLNDDGKSWDSSQWIGWEVTQTAGPGSGDTRQIISNTGTELTVDPVWTAPTGATEYDIQIRPTLYSHTPGTAFGGNQFNLKFDGAQFESPITCGIQAFSLGAQDVYTSEAPWSATVDICGREQTYLGQASGDPLIFHENITQVATAPKSSCFEGQIFVDTDGNTTYCSTAMGYPSAPTKSTLICENTTWRCLESCDATSCMDSEMSGLMTAVDIKTCLEQTGQDSIYCKVKAGANIDVGDEYTITLPRHCTDCSSGSLDSGSKRTLDCNGSTLYSSSVDTAAVVKIDMSETQHDHQFRFKCDLDGSPTDTNEYGVWFHRQNPSFQVCETGTISPPSTCTGDGDCPDNAACDNLPGTTDDVCECDYWITLGRTYVEDSHIGNHDLKDGTEQAIRHYATSGKPDHFWATNNFIESAGSIVFIGSDTDPLGSFRKIFQGNHFSGKDITSGNWCYTEDFNPANADSFNMTMFRDNVINACGGMRAVSPTITSVGNVYSAIGNTTDDDPFWDLDGSWVTGGVPLNTTSSIIVDDSIRFMQTTHTGGNFLSFHNDLVNADIALLVNDVLSSGTWPQGGGVKMLETTQTAVFPLTTFEVSLLSQEGTSCDVVIAGTNMLTASITDPPSEFKGRSNICGTEAYWYGSFAQHTNVKSHSGTAAPTTASDVVKGGDFYIDTDGDTTRCGDGAQFSILQATSGANPYNWRCVYSQDSGTSSFPVVDSEVVLWETMSELKSCVDNAGPDDGTAFRRICRKVNSESVAITADTQVWTLPRGNGTDDYLEVDCKGATITSALAHTDAVIEFDITNQQLAATKVIKNCNIKGSSGDTNEVVFKIQHDDAVSPVVFNQGTFIIENSKFGLTDATGGTEKAFVYDGLQMDTLIEITDSHFKSVGTPVDLIADGGVFEFAPIIKFNRNVAEGSTFAATDVCMNYPQRIAAGSNDQELFNLDGSKFSLCKSVIIGASMVEGHDLKYNPGATNAITDIFTLDDSEGIDIRLNFMSRTATHGLSFIKFNEAAKAINAEIFDRDCDWATGDPNLFVGPDVADSPVLTWVRGRVWPGDGLGGNCNANPFNGPGRSDFREWIRDSIGTAYVDVKINDDPSKDVWIESSFANSNFQVELCGNGPNSATAVYLSPHLPDGGDYTFTGSPDCDDQDSATETTANEVLYNGEANMVGMHCEIEDCGGCDDIVEFQARDDVTDAEFLVCSVTLNGSGFKRCDALDANQIPTGNAGPAWAVQINLTQGGAGFDDLTAQELRCTVYVRRRA